MKIIDKDKESSELYDICQFCGDLWGVDKQKTCKTPCTCATYVNQDYVEQQEWTIGLPILQPWDPTLVPLGETNFWENLTEAGKKRIKDRLPTILQKIDPALRPFLIMLMQGCSKNEVCKELKIDGRTYDKYAERLKYASDGKRGPVQAKSSDTKGDL